MAAIDNGLWKLQMMKLPRRLPRRNKDYPGYRLIINLVICAAVVLFLVVHVRNVVSRHGEKYEQNTKESRRRVNLQEEDYKRAKNAKRSVEQRNDSKPWLQLRLPANIKPKHYNMLIQVYLTELKFSGRSSISIQVIKSTNTIIFHINKLTVKSVQVLRNLEDKMLKIKKRFEFKKNQFFVVVLEEKLDIGEYILKINYDGDIETKELNGFYRSTYKTKDGRTRYCENAY